MRLAAARDMPGIDLLLERSARFQKGAVLRTQIMCQRTQPLPEPVCRHASAGKRLFLDERHQRLRHFKSVLFDPFRHFSPLLCTIVCVSN